MQWAWGGIGAKSDAALNGADLHCERRRARFAFDTAAIASLDE